MELKLDQNLRYLVKLKKLNVTKLSKGAGIPYSTCHDAVYGAEVTKPINIAKLARYFNLTMEEIMFSDLQAEQREIA